MAVEYSDRPIIVLDLSPHEVMRALEALRASRGMVAMQVADKLEAAATPPKPPEPTGLGAVVEDVAGRRWVRVNAEPRPWRLDGRSFCAYGSVSAVRVLSEGVDQ